MIMSKSADNYAQLKNNYVKKIYLNIKYLKTIKIICFNLLQIQRKKKFIFDSQSE